MQWDGQDPASHGDPFGEIGCMRCGTVSCNGGTCEICLEALGELRSLDEDFASQRRALPWHPSRASRLPL